MMTAALLLIDIQRAYFPGGRMEFGGAIEASRTAKRLLDHFRGKDLPVVHIQHFAARTGATFLLPNTEGIDFHEHVNPLSDETADKKHFPNSFRDTDCRNISFPRTSGNWSSAG